jgi:acyl carrier protein
MTSLTQHQVRTFLVQHFSDSLREAGIDLGEVENDFDLLAHGVVDSLGIIEMITAVENYFGITVDFELMDPEQLALLGSFCLFVASNATTRV